MKTVGFIIIIQEKINHYSAVILFYFLNILFLFIYLFFFNYVLWFIKITEFQ